MSFLTRFCLTVTGCILLSLTTISTTVTAEGTAPKVVSLKEIMQGLLDDTQLISKGVFLENYSMIEKGAKQIAQHPPVPMETRKKLLKALGPEMGQFKGFDMKVHKTAVSIAEAAKNKNMEAILSNYHQLVDGCQYCHESFKQRAIEILK